MINHETNWIEPQTLNIPGEFSAALDESEIVLEALLRRGICTVEHARSFLYPQFYRPSDPIELPDLIEAADLLEATIVKGDKIAIWGDFDVDGQTATAVLVEALTQLRANFIYHIPNRNIESHGVNITGLDKVLAQGVKLILTCDTGITAFDAVHHANNHQIPFIITDHHILPKSLPQAHAIINPQRLPVDHKLHPLCGVGTAYQLAFELLRRANKSDAAVNLLDLVALGTIADLASLTGDNRYLVQIGLMQMRNNPRPAIKALLSQASVQNSQVNEQHLGFILAPRLNALGRLGDANPIIPFLLSTDENEINSRVIELESLNSRRKLLCDQVFQGALEQIKRNPSILNDDVLILSHPNWPASVIGIVASRLVELYYRPTILISTDPSSMARASARSVDGMDITHALSEQSSLLLGFGGHAMAAGFSIHPDRVAEFSRAINRSVHALNIQQPSGSNLNIDRFVSLNEISLNLQQSFEMLAPFGQGNPPIILACRDLAITNATTIGKSREHRQVVVEDRSTASAKVLWWQGAGIPLPEERIDLAFTVRAVNFRGQVSPQLEWVNARVHQKPMVEIRKRFTFLDYRKIEEPKNLLTTYINQTNTIIWREGGNLMEIPGFDRFSLFQATHLVLWNIPPGNSEFREIINTVKPNRIIIFGVDSANDQLSPFLSQLAGLAQYCIKQYQGLISIHKLTRLTCQRDSTIRTGLLLLRAKGLIQVEEESDQILRLSSKSTPSFPEEQLLQKKLIHLLTETKAYRNYFKRVDLSLLAEE